MNPIGSNPAVSIVYTLAFIFNEAGATSGPGLVDKSPFHVTY